MLNLVSKKCVPCERGTLPLKPAEAGLLLKEVLGWTSGDDYKKISRDFKFKNFKGAMAFVNKVAELAESEGHHPDILIHGWNKVRLELWTHAIGGLSENDFILAAKIDVLPVDKSHLY